MTEKRLLWILLVLWALAFGWSIWSLMFTAPTGDGFTRGLNRVSSFVGWQLAAAVLAFGIWLAGRHSPPRSFARRLSKVPASLFALLCAVVVALIIYAAFIKNSVPEPPPPPAKPVTAPAD